MAARHHATYKVDTSGREARLSVIHTVCISRRARRDLVKCPAHIFQSLSRVYRALYIVRHDGSVDFVSVEMVTKHAY
jgi:hypothetical protein